MRLLGYALLVGLISAVLFGWICLLDWWLNGRDSTETNAFNEREIDDDDQH